MSLGSQRALRGVSLGVARCEVVGILGPNGAGKSTLARACAGLVPLSGGSVRIEGADAAGLGRQEVARRIAHLPQDIPVDLPFTAAEVVLMGRTPHLGPLGLDGPADRERVAAALARVEAAHLADRPLAALSGGERRRVLLARVLVQEAPIWILDEPTAHLDLAHQQLVLRLARAHADGGGSVLCVLHDLLHAAEVCDRVAVLADGELRAIGKPEEILEPELLGEIFGVRFAAGVHPATGAPLLLPALEARRRV